MRREVAFTGGAVLAAGLLLGLIVDRLARLLPAPASTRPEPAPARSERRDARRQQLPPESLPITDVLERYRVAEAVRGA